MITPQQILNPQVKPKWQLPAGVMESVVAFNCRKYGFPRPVLAMPMWEGAGNRALDYSGHGNHGTISGADWVADGLDIDATSNWVDANGVTTGVNHTIVALVKTSSTDNKNRYIFDSQTGRIVFGRLTNTSTLSYYDGAWHNSGLIIADGVWHFTAISKSETSISIYVDDNSDSKSGSSVSIGADCAVGAKYTGTDNWFDGIIDNVQIYNAALTAAQVKFLYDNPYFMYEIPEELYGYVSAVVGEANPYWYYQMLKRRN